MTRLLATVNRSTGQVVKTRPKYVGQFLQCLMLQDYMRVGVDCDVAKCQGFHY